MINRTITLLIQSMPTYVSLNERESKNIDLDQDGIYDIRVSYNEMLINRIDLTINELANDSSKSKTDFIEEELVKEVAHPAVFLIRNNQKHAFINEKAFLSRGYTWDRIRIVEDLSQIETGDMIYEEKEADMNLRFKNNLQYGSTGNDVKELQKYLNMNGFLIAENGPGSPGNETETFGILTQSALKRFQQANQIKPSSGYFGPLTRAFIR